MVQSNTVLGKQFYVFVRELGGVLLHLPLQGDGMEEMNQA